MPCLRLLLAALLGACWLAPAHAGPTEPADAAAEAEPDLYVLALKAISEGNKEAASKALARMIAKGPRHESEWLDLAVIQCAIGHGEDADRLFSAIEQRFDPPQGIRDIIAQQRLQGCRKWKPFSQLSLVAARGYDQNLNQGASNPSYSLGGTGGATLDLLPEFLPQRDQYTLVSGDYVRELSEKAAVGFAQVQLRRNDRLSNYNTASLFGGIEQPWQLGRWQLRGTLLGGALTLGGRLYQEQAQVQLRLTPPLPLPAGVEFYGLGGVSHVNYKTLTNFDANTEELRAVLSYRADKTQAQFSAGYQNDHAVGQRPGGDRSGRSFALSARHRINSLFQAELDLSRQTWQGQLPYSAPLIDVVRHQDTRAARATLVYLLGERQSVQLEARHVQNKENISLFQYNNNVLQLSWHLNGF
jgi:hypothetical protein